MVTIFLAVMASVVLTAGVMNWINGDYTRNKHEAELATTKNQYESRIRDLEDKIRDLSAAARKTEVPAKQSEPETNALDGLAAKPSSAPAVDSSNRTNMARASTFILKARSLYEKKQYQAAINECDKALSVDSKNETARQLRAEIQNTMKILNPR